MTCPLVTLMHMSRGDLAAPHLKPFPQVTQNYHINLSSFQHYELKHLVLSRGQAWYSLPAG